MFREYVYRQGIPFHRRFTISISSKLRVSVDVFTEISYNSSCIVGAREDLFIMVTILNNGYFSMGGTKTVVSDNDYFKSNVFYKCSHYSTHVTDSDVN